MCKIIGHRGSRHLWPENTLEGFRALLTAGVEGVEFDVHLTADDTVVVIHDATIERTTDGSGPVRAQTLHELQSVLVRGSAEGIPTLEQVLDIFQASGLELHIELKTDTGGQPYPGLETRVLGSVRQYGLQQHSVLTSFDHQVLENVRSMDRSARVLRSLDRRTVKLAGGIEQAVKQLETIPDLYIAVEQSLLKEKWVQFSAICGERRLGVWVVNDHADLTYWFRQGVRQVTTDRVDHALQARLQQGPRERLD